MTARESFGSEYSRYRTAVREALQAESAPKSEIDRVLSVLHPLAGISVQEVVGDSTDSDRPEDPAWPYTPDVLSKPGFRRMEDVSLPPDPVGGQ